MGNLGKKIKQNKPRLEILELKTIAKTKIALTRNFRKRISDFKNRLQNNMNWISDKTKGLKNKNRVSVTCEII